MKKLSIVLLATLVIFPFMTSSQLLAETTDTYDRLRRWTPYFAGDAEKVYSVTSYEFSRINIGSRKIEWNTYGERLFYKAKKAMPYFEVIQHDRDRTIDYTLTGGLVYAFEKSVLTQEFGFGAGADFIYRFQSTTEYEHALINSFYGKWKVRYLHYDAGDVFIASPAGFTYYFGNHYWTADYNFSISESRADAHWATTKVNFVLHPRVHLYGGTALGQRLFDIFEIDAGEQEGFILFFGTDLRVTENIQLTVGYSYAEENPTFIKRSVNAGLSVKF